MARKETAYHNACILRKGRVRATNRKNKKAHHEKAVIKLDIQTLESLEERERGSRYRGIAGVGGKTLILGKGSSRGKEATMLTAGLSLLGQLGQEKSRGKKSGLGNQKTAAWGVYLKTGSGT